MDGFSAILLFGAALTGFFLLSYMSNDLQSPALLVLSHIILAVSGYIVLLIYAFTTEQPEKHYHTLIMLTIAGITGIWLWISKESAIRQKVWAIVYSLLGLFAFLWLLTFIMPAP